MPDKETATKLLGFRDDSGALVCPADVVDGKKSYTCHLGAEDGSYKPTEADLKTIGELFKAVGLDASCTNVQGKGGSVFKNKKGIVVCRLVEGKSAPAPKKPEPEPVVEVTCSPGDPCDVEACTNCKPTPEPQEEVEAVAEAKVEVAQKPAKKSSKKKAGNKRKK